MENQKGLGSTKRLKIAFVCDFFYPRLGGVEMHIYSLATCLVRLGHKVVIISHAYSCSSDGNSNERQSKRTGVRYLPGPIKVYYCPILPMTDQDALPTFCATFPLLRWILIREGIEIVHSHQATSTLANEAIVYAGEMGLASVYTDHSLFGFDDLASVILNRVLKTTLCTVSAAICVSYTCRENFIMRANMDPSVVHAIPNAIDASKFSPDLSKRSKDRIKVVVVSRLVYRKGVDLLVGIIPKICKQYPYVDFIIGGDGNKKLTLEEMVERERLQDRVEFLGAVPHSSVRDVLCSGHVFLNCSLTESFCIAILEAASTGLFVVSTDVGGVPEVLPHDMIYMASPSVSGLVDKLSSAIEDKVMLAGNGNNNTNSDCGQGMMVFDPYDFHKRVGNMYSWSTIALKTIQVYEHVLKRRRLTLLERLARYKTVGPFAGSVAWVLALTVHFFVRIIEWRQPRSIIDVVPDVDIVSPEKLETSKGR